MTESIDIPEKPRLRNIEIFPTEMENRPVLCLKDPEGFASGMLVLTREAGVILSQLNGTNSLADVKSGIRKSGAEISEEDLIDFVNTLDENLFLDSKRFREEKEKQIQNFHSKNVRTPATAGTVYPEDEESCRTYLTNLLQSPSEESLPTLPDNQRLKGFISPHIDLERGFETYARTYAPLHNCFEDELFVVFGTSHAPMNSLLAPTDKDYSTPLGTIPTDSNLAGKLKEALPGDRREDEYIHKNEHSIEFQILFLSHLLKSNPDGARVLPILCSSFKDSETTRIQSPQNHSQWSEEIETINEILTETDRNIIYVCGADLAHVGQRFGDPERTTDQKLKWVEREDLDSLSYCENLDPEGFLNHVARNDEKRKICGLSPIYMTLQCIEADRGELVEYRQAVNKEEETTVSFAGMYFFQESTPSNPPEPQ